MSMKLIFSAGYIATAMGLPIKLVAAVNQNGATHKILSTGIWKEPKEVLRSSSCSMDIAVSQNYSWNKFQDLKIFHPFPQLLLKIIFTGLIVYFTCFDVF